MFLQINHQRFNLINVFRKSGLKYSKRLSLSTLHIFGIVNTSRLWNRRKLILLQHSLDEVARKHVFPLGKTN